VPALPPPPRVVADSNVLISALYGGLRSGAVLQLALRGTITLCASPYILDEVARILDRRLDWAPARIHDALTALRVYTKIVGPSSRRITVVRDPKDNPILECARAAYAKYLITGDRDLLTLGTYRRLRIVTIREFLAAYPLSAG
jgi:putative PIN family toxin of toxin-antitoxin system